MLAGLSFAAGSKVERHDFRFSHGGFRDDDIFESSTATPGRYILEIGRRLIAASAQAELLAIGNPLLPLSAAQLAAWLGERRAEPGIIADSAGFPVVYVIPRRVFAEDSRLLLCLSTRDAGLDAQLLYFAAGVEFPVANAPLSGLDAFPAFSSNGWLNPDQRLRGLKRQAERALTLCRSDRDWRRRPFVLFHPYHAGDALFVALASKEAAPLLYDGQIVCSAFKDVVESAAPRLQPIELSMPPMARDGSVSKYDYFVKALNHLGDDFLISHFVVFGRLLRMYHFTPFHLIDHARFTLGDPMDRPERTIGFRPAAPLRLLEESAGKLRLLFHLNGGWDLKTYPQDRTRALFQTLRTMGCEITVIDRPDLEEAGARSVKAGDIASLTAQVDSHHLFVGVDSFPLHFATHVRRRPTVALFGSTRPCNSDAARDDGYQALVGTLPCNSCLAKNGCPILRRGDCINYPEPREVASTIVEMASRLYGFTPEI